ncbi:hypothetical protein G9P44_005334 [Scheffersomyces stipitis]|nr:hypothetical protein G9P44_005334 [Scheffersomyces stipitis]
MISVRSGTTVRIASNPTSLSSASKFKFYIPLSSIPRPSLYFSIFRSYSTTKKPQSFINNNFIVKSLNYVKNVDEQQKSLENYSTEDKVNELLTHISTNSELLYMLSLFHYECQKLKITNSDLKNRKKSVKFTLNFFLRLQPINEAFWDVCHIINISNHNHKLSYNVHDLGLLDPKNFSDEVYNKLQTGIYNGVDFRNVETVSFARPNFTRETENK